MNTLDLFAVDPGRRSHLAAMLDDYLRELSGHREVAVGASTAADYPYLDAYFAERGRRPLFIRNGGEIVGFALVRGPESTGSAWEMSEFYVVPHKRRSGVGRKAIACIWRRFPGDWELQVHARNAAARQFWTACAAAWAAEPPHITEIAADDGARIQLNFRVATGG